MRRAAHLGLLLMLVASSSVAASAAAAPPAGAHGSNLSDATGVREPLPDLAVGTQLTAVAEVRLHRAVISKGSKVSVFGVSRKRGSVDSVDVQLADGHVVRDVGIGTIRSLFRVAPRD